MRTLQFPRLLRELSAIEWPTVITICAFCGAVTFFILLLVSLLRAVLLSPAPKQWNSAAIRSDFVEMKLEQVEKSKAALVFYYDLTNKTNFDYYLSDSSGVQFERRLKSTGRLVPENRLQLVSGVTVQSGNQTRIALEFIEPFAWPNKMDETSANNIQNLVIQETRDLDGFVLLDGTRRFQIDFARSWQLPPQIAVVTK